jgi:uncharacterized membrane protein (DUF4010 family)
MPAPLDAHLVWSLAAALIIGALVGIEREKSKAQSGHIGIGGVRTFILFSLTGAVSAWLSQVLASAWVFVAAVAAVGALAVARYVVQSRSRPDAVGLTTETAAVGVCLLGGACVVGQVAVALALGVAFSAILAYKRPMHALVAKLGSQDIEAGVKLLAATFIVLPLLPADAIDPWGVIHPRLLWMLVILIAGLSLVGYVASRALGEQRGTTITGLTGGLVSSTAVTLAFARQSREEAGRTDDALAAGLLIAWGVMSIRVVVLAAVVHAPLVAPLLVPFGAMTAVTLAAVVLLMGRTRKQEPAVAGSLALRNPFSLTAAMKFALLFAAVLVVVELARRHFPGGGYYVVAALAGLTDVDAITLSMSSLVRDGGVSATIAARALVVAALSNTVVKCGMVVAIAGAALRWRTLLVTALLLAVGLATAFLG